MTVRAKFFCNEVKKTTSSIDGPSYGFVTLAPAYGPGNESWSAATPCGKIEMTITNEAALDQFVPGKLYEIEFKAADEAVSRENDDGS